MTAGNACGRNDGAAALVLTSSNHAERLGIKPIARVINWAAAGVSPELMGIGPVPAVRKLLKRTGLILSEICLIELNEAFASQALAVFCELALDIERVNVNGGAIALGTHLGLLEQRL